MFSFQRPALGPLTAHRRRSKRVSDKRSQFRKMSSIPSSSLWSHGDPPSPCPKNFGTRPESQRDKRPLKVK